MSVKHAKVALLFSLFHYTVHQMLSASLCTLLYAVCPAKNPICIASALEEIPAYLAYSEGCLNILDWGSFNQKQSEMMAGQPSEDFIVLFSYEEFCPVFSPV